MLMFFITGLSPVNDTLPVSRTGIGFVGRRGVPAAVLCRLALALRKYRRLTTSARAAAEAAPQLIKNFFIF
jgi:hypothetical protein